MDKILYILLYIYTPVYIYSNILPIFALSLLLAIQILTGYFNCFPFLVTPCTAVGAIRYD